MNNKDWKPIKPQRSSSLLEEREMRLAAEKELDELKAWKEQAMEVMNKLQLQEIAKELELPLGSDIPSQILPAIKHLVKDEYAKEVTECYGKLKDEFDQWKECAEELAKALQNLGPDFRIQSDGSYSKERIALENFEKLKQNDPKH